MQKGALFVVLCNNPISLSGVYHILRTGTPGPLPDEKNLNIAEFLGPWVITAWNALLIVLVWEPLPPLPVMLRIIQDRLCGSLL